MMLWPLNKLGSLIRSTADSIAHRRQVEVDTRAEQEKQLKDEERAEREQRRQRMIERHQARIGK